MSELSNRYDFIYLFDVQDGNPNGDPDAANLPRIDNETGKGLVTDVCLKRKVRNYVDTACRGTKGYDIFIQEAAVLDNRVEDAYNDDTVKTAPDENQKEIAQKILCNKYYDIRAFGAVIATTNKNGQVRGPIQLTFARSIDPIVSHSHSITRMVVSANLAKQTGFTSDDLELLWKALENMFDLDRSAARGLMAARKLIVFEHSTELGNAPANRLFDLVKITKKNSVATPRSFDDYTVTIDKEHLPAGVTLIERI